MASSLSFPVAVLTLDVLTLAVLTLDVAMGWCWSWLRLTGVLRWFPAPAGGRCADRQGRH